MCVWGGPAEINWGRVQRCASQHEEISTKWFQTGKRWVTHESSIMHLKIKTSGVHLPFFTWLTKDEWYFTENFTKSVKWKTNTQNRHWNIRVKENVTFVVLGLQWRPITGGRSSSTSTSVLLRNVGLHYVSEMERIGSDSHAALRQEEELIAHSKNWQPISEFSFWVTSTSVIICSTSVDTTRKKPNGGWRHVISFLRSPVAGLFWKDSCQVSAVFSRNKPYHKYVSVGASFSWSVGSDGSRPSPAFLHWHLPDAALTETSRMLELKERGLRSRNIDWC